MARTPLGTATSNPPSPAGRNQRRSNRPKPPEPTSVLLHRGPQAVLVQPEDVELRLLPRPARHHRPALVVDVEHQLGRLLQAVAEQLLEDVGDVAHEVHGIVPDEDDPGLVGDVVEVADRRVDLARGGAAHGPAPAAAGRGDVDADLRCSSVRCTVVPQTAIDPTTWRKTR